MGAVIFLSAGRTDLSLIWAYLGIIEVLLAALCIRANLDLWRERFKPAGPSRDNLSALRALSAVIFLAQWIIAGVDMGRAHWSAGFPVALQVAGWIGFVGGFALMGWAQKVNRFFSSAVRIQDDRGHKVITDGPYRIVRHPGYLAFILISASIAMMLGSYVALLPTIAWAAMFIRRCLFEDALLRRELPGYADYALHVRHRIVPGVW
jgi:protein-S-isoprenylcysteine O-methyltransferase Ste14